MSDITKNEDELGRGFFLDGADLPEQIADSSRKDELDDIARRNILLRLGATGRRCPKGNSNTRL
jgi:hypothetical protein